MLHVEQARFQISLLCLSALVVGQERFQIKMNQVSAILVRLGVTISSLLLPSVCCVRQATILRDLRLSSVQDVARVHTQGVASLHARYARSVPIRQYWVQAV